MDSIKEYMDFIRRKIENQDATQDEEIHEEPKKPPKKKQNQIFVIPKQKGKDEQKDKSTN